MHRLLTALLVCAAALPAAEGKGDNPKRLIGAQLARQALGPAQIVDARAVNGMPGHVLIRWGDLDNVITKDTPKSQGFTWSGTVSGHGATIVRTVLFENAHPGKDGAPNKSQAHRGDRLLPPGGTGGFSWQTRTRPHWDGVVVRAKSGETLTVTCGAASFTVTVP